MRTPEQKPFLRFIETVAGSVLVIGCAAGGHVEFRQTNASFKPSPRSSEPIVYRVGDVVPNVKLQSVGMIEVRGGDVDARAAAEGKQLGCWALIEHSLFDHLQRQPRTSSSSEAIALFAHGGAPHVSSVRPPLSTQFDCVTTDESAPAKPLVM